MIQWLVQNSVLVTLIFTGVVTLSTAVYAVLTALLVSETRRMRKAQTEPRLAAFFEPVEEFINIGHLYIQNIGLGPAYDISFEFEPDGSIEGAKKLIDDFCSTKFLHKGVKYLGPGQKLRSGYTTFTEDLTEKIKAVVVVTLHYRSSADHEYQEEYRIDFSELEGTGRVGKPHLYSIAQSLEKIQRDFGHLCTGFSKLRVHIYNHDDRERETKQWEEQRKKRQEPKVGPNS